MHANQRGKTTPCHTMRGVCSVIPSDTTALVHESMRDAELHTSVSIGAVSAVSAVGAVGATSATARPDPRQP